MLITVVLVTAFTTIGAAACFQVMQSSGAFFTQAVTCTFYKCMKASLTAIKYRPLWPSTQRSSPAKPKKASDGAQLELMLGCIEGSSSIEYLATSGTVAIAGQDLAQLSVKQLEEFRLNHIGFIFQQPQLLDGVTLRENAILPSGIRNRTSRWRPLTPIGGFADEPTGALDSENAAAVLDVWTKLHQDGLTIVMVTHDAAVAARAQRIITVTDGVVPAVGRRKARKLRGLIGSTHLRPQYFRGRLPWRVLLTK